MHTIWIFLFYVPYETEISLLLWNVWRTTNVYSMWHLIPVKRKTIWVFWHEVDIFVLWPSKTSSCLLASRCSSLLQWQACTDLFSRMIGRLPSHWQRTFFIISPLFLSSFLLLQIIFPFILSFFFFRPPPSALPLDFIWQEIFQAMWRGCRSRAVADGIDRADLHT